MKNRKKYLKKYIEEEVDFNSLNDLNPRLYKHYGQSVSEQKTTTEYVDKIKELRNKYIKLWNYSNDFYDDYDPLWNHINDKIADYAERQETIPSDINTLITKRNSYKSYHDAKTKSRIAATHRSALNLLYEGDDNADNIILMQRILVSYSADSINKNLNTDNSEDYVFSPNSIEIHCTTVKTQDKDTDPKDTKNHITPSNFYGHVTLTVIGSISKSDEKQIVTLAIKHKDKDDNPSKTMHNCTEYIEKQHRGRTFHYGIFIDPHTNKKEEKWWSNNHSMQHFDQETFTTDDIGSTFFPEHNSPMQLMKEYYLKCINTCPEEIVFRPFYERGQTKLTFKDLTDWDFNSWT